MTVMPIRRYAPGLLGAGALLVLLAAGSARAQVVRAAGTDAEAKGGVVRADGRAAVDGGVVQAGCSTCGQGLIGGMMGGGGGGAGCANCGARPIPPAGCGDCCGTGCVPGRFKDCCSCCDECSSALGRALCEFYQCICCPDPCYEPRWFPLIDSAFFVDAARPVTQTRFRIDTAWGLQSPDRAEYFWARVRTNPNQIGAPTCPKFGFGKGPDCIVRDLNYQELSYYTEAANGNASFFFEMPYRHLDPRAAAIANLQQPDTGLGCTTGAGADVNDVPPALCQQDVIPAGGQSQPRRRFTFLRGATGLPNNIILTNGGTLPNGAAIAPGTMLPRGQVLPAGTVFNAGFINLANPPGSNTVAGNCCPQSGFADLNLGTKAVLLDCECLTFTFQFKTFLPTGNFTKGLGTGHVSLEPSFLYSLKLTCDDYLQGQISYWIPIGGDELYQGNVFHGHWSWNRTLCCPCPGVQIVGTLESSLFVVCNGAYTGSDFLLAVPQQNGTTQLTPAALAATTTMFSAGPGIRVFLCDKLDFGVGSQFALTGTHWAEQLLRTELRLRF